MDHLGRVPKLVREGFTGEIYSHPATHDLARPMLEDALSRMEFESKEHGQKPYYSKEDIETSFSHWKDISYNESQNICGYKVTLRDAGHILGSGMFELEYDGKRILFTGDLGNSPSILLPDTEPIKDIDYLVMESVYGDRNHEDKDERTEKLKQTILDTISRGGTLIIPAFSLERTQMIIYEINNLVEDKKIPSIPVFVDSPLAIKVTDIYKKYINLFNKNIQEEIRKGDDIFSFPKLKYTIRPAESRAIEETPNPKIIIAGSGMSVGGRVLDHESKHLSDPKSTVLLVGFQPLGTLGRQLEDGIKKIKINGREIPVHAHIEVIRAYSSHKDSDHLIEFVESSAATLKKVFVAMGEPKSSLYLAQRLRDYLDVNAIYPEKGKTYELS